MFAQHVLLLLRTELLFAKLVLVPEEQNLEFDRCALMVASTVV